MSWSSFTTKKSFKKKTDQWNVGETPAKKKQRKMGEKWGGKKGEGSVVVN
jgi:hypothetical protein